MRAICRVRLIAALVGGAAFCASAEALSSDEKADVLPPAPQCAETYPATTFIASSPDELAESPLSLSLALEHEPFARQVRLGPVDTNALRQYDRDHPDPYKRLRIGIGRTIEIDAADGTWNRLPDGGYLWTLAVVSAQAVGMRLHVSGCALPAGGELRFMSASDTSRVHGPFTGGGPFGTGAFWSTVLPGDEVYVEYHMPPARGAVPASVPFVIDEIQHLYRDVRAAIPCPREGDCHNDVTCYGEWEGTSNAVARVAYVDGDSMVCTGELINTLLGDLTPYFLTAGHCIESEAVAQTMVFYWKYRTETCDGPPPDVQTVPTSSVGELLAHSPWWDQDYSLVMVLGEFPPGPYTWAGWTTTNVTEGTPCSCIHHPDGAYQRISFATKTSGAPSGQIRMDWYDGPTEPGSSGSGAYLDSTQQLVGALIGGPSSCEDESYDDFSAFQHIYPGISSYLQGGSDDLLEDNDSCTAAAAAAPCIYDDLVLKYADEDWYRVTSSSCGPVDITLNFTDAFGNIDMTLYDACGGGVVASSTGNGDSEAISIPPGESREYWLRVYLAGNVRNTYDMTITAAEGGTKVYPIEAGVSIPDDNAAGVDHGFIVPDPIVLTGLKVAVKIAHTWNGDLRVKLTHNGTTVTLIDRPGVPASSVGFNNDGFDVLLDDAAFTPIEDYDSGGPMVVGTFAPNESLSLFDGQDAAGLWTLNVSDHEDQDTGTLESWALHIPPAEPCDCGGDGDVNTNGSTDLADFAAFQRCFTGTDVGPPPLGCQSLNFDCDWDVDLDDFAEFMNVFTTTGNSEWCGPALRQTPPTVHTRATP